MGQDLKSQNFGISGKQQKQVLEHEELYTEETFAWILLQVQHRTRFHNASMASEKSERVAVEPEFVALPSAV